MGAAQRVESRELVQKDRHRDSCEQSPGHPTIKRALPRRCTVLEAGERFLQLLERDRQVGAEVDRQCKWLGLRSSICKREAASFE
jgi:hypothetical protein